MADVDAVASQLLEEAKRFLEKASGATEDAQASEAYLHAALMLSFSALEAHINSLCEDFALRPELSAHERGLLLERDVLLKDGIFVVRDGLKISRLEDRIRFLFARFSRKGLDHSHSWWGSLSAAIKLRNELTHPKGKPHVTEKSVTSAIESIIECLDSLYRNLFKRRFPARNRSLQSTLNF